MKFKRTRILLAVTALVSMLSTQAAAASFSDVPESAWYYDAVEDVYAQDWMIGTGAKQFSPDASLTRAMLSVILWRIGGCPDTNNTVVFTDTKTQDWFAKELSWCVQTGIFEGFPDGSFHPEEKITWEQFATVFYRYTDGKLCARTQNTAHADLRRGCAWAADACAWANESGLFTGDMGTIDLCASVSRAEIAYWLSTCFSSPAAVTEGDFQAMNMKYILYTPKNAAANMPLIVYLHGGHGKGSDVSVLTEENGFPKYLTDGELGDVPAYVLIPQLSAEEKSWKPAAVMALIDKICTENSIDSSRISLTGHSMGGTGTWDLALAYPDVFSRIAPMSGTIKTNADTLAALDHMPIWAFVGTEDKVVNPISTQEFIQEISKQNTDARVTVLQGVDHANVPEHAWLDSDLQLIDWLIS